MRKKQIKYLKRVGSCSVCLGCQSGTGCEDSGQHPGTWKSRAVWRVRVEGVSESVTLASRSLGDSPECLAGFSVLCCCEAAWDAWDRSLLLLCHILLLRQTDSFAHWNSRAGGAAVKTNTGQLTGGLRPVFWGLFGPSTPKPQ